MLSKRRGEIGKLPLLKQNSANARRNPGFYFNMKSKNESVDFYIALFMMLMAITNIVLIIVNVTQLFLRPFSIGISVFLFYFAWKQITELETYKKIQMLFFLHHLEKEAEKEAKKVIENVIQESKS